MKQKKLRLVEDYDGVYWFEFGESGHFGKPFKSRKLAIAWMENTNKIIRLITSKKYKFLVELLSNEATHEFLEKHDPRE